MSYMIRKKQILLRAIGTADALEKSSEGMEKSQAAIQELKGDLEEMRKLIEEKQAKKAAGK